MGRLSLTLVLVLAGSSAACSGGGEGGTTRSVLPDVTLASCTGPRADEPVAITLAHTESRIRADALDRLVADFEATHPNVDVTVEVGENGYPELMRRWSDAEPADRPQLALFPQHQTGRLVDSGQTVQPDRCMSSVVPDMVPAVEAAWSVDGVLRAVPLGVSTPVLLYNRRAFARAGLEPDDPPATLEGVRAVSERLLGSGATATGLVVETGTESGGTWVVEHWAAQAGEPTLRPANGREGRAESVAWDEPWAVEALAWLADMLSSGLAVTAGTNTGGLDNITRAIRRDAPAGMTIHTSGALAEILDMLPGMGLTGFELGVAPLPGPGPGTGSLPGGTALWMAAGKPEAEVAAAWELAAYLAAAPANARWAAATGYVPLSASAGSLEPLRTTWAERPELRVAFDVLAAQGTSPAAVGPLSGPQAELHGLLAEAVTGVVDDGADPAEALAEAAEDADGLLAAYNTGAPG
jgi:sn-glycerol 3-phosphate transport system substrate-binding protein